MSFQIYDRVVNTAVASVAIIMVGRFAGKDGQLILHEIT